MNFKWRQPKHGNSRCHKKLHKNRNMNKCSINQEHLSGKSHEGRV